MKVILYSSTTCRRKPNLDWADDLDDIVEPLPSDISMVTLERNGSGSLGFQIASSGGVVYVKQITAEPALSCPDIQVGDKIVLVCFKFTSSFSECYVSITFFLDI